MPTASELFDKHLARLHKAETGEQHANILHDYSQEMKKYGHGHDMAHHGEGKSHGDK